MKGTEFRKNLVGVITISLSFALGMTLYNAFLIADMEDLEKSTSSKKPTPPPKPIPMTKDPMINASGHGDAVSDKKDDSQRQTVNKQMVESAPASQMLG
jgi:hypothetical protein|tara:strand:- start:2673 stop:2969 length:297 start_codon:yes stop_codon:yes gene_type:complete